MNNKGNYTVEKLCKCMRLSARSYYDWCNSKGTTKVNKSTLYLKERIQLLFDENRQVYGSIRIQRALAKEQLYYSRSYIAALMRQMGLKSVVSRKFKVVTTDSNHNNKVFDNVLNRDFNTTVLGQKWVSDITYIKVGSKWNYVTTIIDLADRKVLAWTLTDGMTTQETVYKAWIKARSIRTITKDHIFHSDRGVQYASNKMTVLFKNNQKVTQSMSRKGNCWDNAVAESFFKTLKYECTNRYIFKNQITAYNVIKDYIQWYNYKRMHSALDYKSPAEKELEIRIVNNKKVA